MPVRVQSEGEESDPWPGGGPGSGSGCRVRVQGQGQRLTAALISNASSMLSNNARVAFKPSPSRVGRTLGRMRAWSESRDVFFALRRTPALTRSAVWQNGNTPLHYAAGSGHTEVVKVLMEAGATVEATNKVRAPPVGVREGGG